jgi:hypothetical protein
VSVDLAEFLVTSEVAAWCKEVFGSMAARGVADMTSKISIDEDDEASLWRENWGAGVEVFWSVAYRIYGALAAALRRENARDGMRCGMAQAHRPGYI